MNSSAEFLFDEVMKFCTPECLKKISAEIITAYREKKYSVLIKYSRRLDMSVDTGEISMNRLFVALIKSYHPDRIESLRRNIRDAFDGNNVVRLEEFAAQLGVPGYVEVSGANDTAFDTEYEEVYGFDQSMEAGWYEFSEEEATGEAFPGDDDYFNDEDDFSGGESGYGFREAISEEMLGNLVSEDLQVRPGDLIELEELILADREMQNLEGIEHCQNLTVLDISGNELESIGPLASLKLLKILDLSRNRVNNLNALSDCTDLLYLNLSDNEITDITPLGELQGLVSLDLSHNYIESLEVLLELPALESLVLYGSAAMDSVSIEMLEQRGVVVIY